MTTLIFYEKPGCSNNARQKRLLLEAGHETITFALLSSESRARVFLGPAMHEVRSEHTLFERVPP